MCGKNGGVAGKAGAVEFRIPGHRAGDPEVHAAAHAVDLNFSIFGNRHDRVDRFFEQQFMVGQRKFRHQFRRIGVMRRIDPLRSRAVQVEESDVFDNLQIVPVVVAVDPEEDLARLLPQKCKHLLPVGDAVGADDAAVGKYDASSRRGANRIA